MCRDWKSPLPDDNNARLPDLHQEGRQVRQQSPGKGGDGDSPLVFVSNQPPLLEQ